MLNIGSLNVVDLLLDALCIVEPDSRIVFVSPAFERIFGYTPEEAVGLRMLDLVHPDDLSDTKRQADSIMQGALQLEFENRYIRKDGRIAHIRWTARKAQDSDMRVALAHDITERKAMESLQAAVYAISEAAHATLDLAALFARVHGIVGKLLASQDLAVVLYDQPTGQLTHAYPPRESEAISHVDQHPQCARVLSTGKAVLEHLRDLSQPDLAVSEHSLGINNDPQRPGFGRYWMGVPLPGANGPIGVLMLQGEEAEVRDTQKDKALLQFVSTQIASAIESTRMRERLIQMAQFDALTGLPNRLLLRDHLAGALCRARRGSSAVSVLFIDLNHFKQFNDTLGHAAGDTLLQQVGQRLSACLRSGDTVARMGGDEFVVLLEGSPPEQHSPDAVQHKLAQAFTAPFFLGEPATPVTVHASIGMARYPDDGTDQDTLLGHADAAMYANKQAQKSANFQPRAASA